MLLFLDDFIGLETFILVLGSLKQNQEIFHKRNLKK